MKTAYSYIRFSSKRQELGDSLRRQVDAAKVYCDSKGWQLSDHSFRDLGISGFKDVNRPSLADMLVAIEQGTIAPDSVIIIENLDRLSRAGIDQTHDIVKSILRHNVEIVSLHDGLHLTHESLNDLIAVIRLAVSADLAYQESSKKSQRVQDNKTRQKQAAMNGEIIAKRLVFWLSRENNKYVLNDNAEVVRLIIEKRLEGKGFHKIAIELNEAGYISRLGRAFSDTTIRDWVKSPALYGDYQTGSVVDGKFVKGDLVIGYFPALCDYSTWKKIQSSFVKRTGGNSKHNHLSGLVRCSHCGGAMHKKISKRTTKTRTIEYKQWICVTSRSGGCKLKKGIRDLDELVFKASSWLVVEDITPSNELSDLHKNVDHWQKRVDLFNTILITAPQNVIDSIISQLSNAVTLLDRAKAALADFLNSHNDINKNDVDTLINFKLDPVQFNLQLKRLITKIVVEMKEGKMWHITLMQRNGYLINITALRNSERSPFKVFLSSTEQIIRIGTYERNEELDFDGDYLESIEHAQFDHMHE